jgi:hypothetical protein
MCNTAVEFIARRPEQTGRMKKNRRKGKVRTQGKPEKTSTMK